MPWPGCKVLGAVSWDWPSRGRTRLLGCEWLGEGMAWTPLRCRYPPLYTFFTTGIAGSITTFSSWMLYGYRSFANFEGYDRGGLYDVSL